ncbi:MAG TPA: translation elongation factor 4 [Candidatus Saccharimonadales bacterium]|nr:translation elongation factor 4 [Candidatus Saccharimonadales bacterium]
MQKIRNFAIAAHIDHGKSTLADRMLELTSTVEKSKMKEQLLDQMDIERERGITIKLQPVRMNWKGYILNLIDTPGHVDFSYEVSRSLAAVEGVILLVDATQGIQAQTLSNFFLSKKQNLKIIPVINKIDMSAAEPEKIAEEMVEILQVKKEDILQISAKEGTNVEKVLDAVVERVPEPITTQEEKRALIFDSSFDPFKGVVAYVRLFDGNFTKGEPIKFLGSKSSGTVLETGYFKPGLVEKESLEEGEIGYIATGLKDASQVRVGDTIVGKTEGETPPLPGYREVRSMVFAGFYPVDNDKFPALKDALEKLKLNDASLTFEADSSTALGFGFRCGFLGLLHFEVVQERLEREYNLELVASSPTVKYQIELTSGENIEVANPTKFPAPNEIRSLKEPIITATIVSKSDYLGAILELLNNRRAEVADIKYIASQVVVEFTLPLAEVVSDFYDRLKSISSGYASFDYELAGWEEVDSVKMDILVAKEVVDALSQIVVRKKSEEVGRKLVEKLKEVLPRQNFEVSVQASVGGKIIARADVPAFRKDVTAKLYGGDVTRKNKLLDKQKKGKQRMKAFGKVVIPQEAFLSVLKI